MTQSKDLFKKDCINYYKDSQFVGSIEKSNNTFIVNCSGKLATFESEQSAKEFIVLSVTGCKVEKKVIREKQSFLTF